MSISKSLQNVFNQNIIVDMNNYQLLTNSVDTLKEVVYTINGKNPNDLVVSKMLNSIEI